MRGFTAIELMTVIAVGGILLALAMPSFNSLFRSNQAATTANELVTAIQMARTEAVTRGTRVTICPSTTGTTCSGTSAWQNGWILFTDCNGGTTAGVVDAANTAPCTADTVLRVFPALKGSGATLSSATGSKTYLSYIPNGFMCTAGTNPACTGYAAPTTFNLTMPSCPQGCNRRICVNAQGRPNVQNPPSAACS